jgi:hypothetical protein
LIRYILAHDELAKEPGQKASLQGGDCNCCYSHSETPPILLAQAQRSSRRQWATRVWSSHCWVDEKTWAEPTTVPKTKARSRVTRLMIDRIISLDFFPPGAVPAAVFAAGARPFQLRKLGSRRRSKSRRLPREFPLRADIANVRVGDPRPSRSIT